MRRGRLVEVGAAEFAGVRPIIPTAWFERTAERGALFRMLTSPPNPIKTHNTPSCCANGRNGSRKQRTNLVAQPERMIVRPILENDHEGAVLLPFDTSNADKVSLGRWAKLSTRARLKGMPAIGRPTGFSQCVLVDAGPSVRERRFRPQPKSHKYVELPFNIFPDRDLGTPLHMHWTELDRERRLRKPVRRWNRKANRDACYLPRHSIK